MERSIDVREKHQSIASHIRPDLTGDEPACALTRDPTGDLSFPGMMPKQLSHTGQGFSPF